MGKNDSKNQYNFISIKIITLKIELFTPLGPIPHRRGNDPNHLGFLACDCWSALFVLTYWKVWEFGQVSLFFCKLTSSDRSLAMERYNFNQFKPSRAAWPSVLWFVQNFGVRVCAQKGATFWAHSLLYTKFFSLLLSYVIEQLLQPPTSAKIGLGGEIPHTQPQIIEPDAIFVVPGRTFLINTIGQPNLGAVLSYRNWKMDCQNMWSPYVVIVVNMCLNLFKQIIIWVYIF